MLEPRRLLAKLLRLGWLPEAWAPPKETRKVREKIRRRAYLVWKRERHLPDEVLPQAGRQEERSDRSSGHRTKAAHNHLLDAQKRGKVPEHCILIEIR
ncbi:hypothetical protein AKJ62_03635 [candidate division MSBL1 archaeon SCGC-AAA259D14]|uniref:Uncharacterized protein n=1 Tax=candidate division MSBL1 archaeon SCGC-AAA259D14 TaxID=1698261 RepID=A0A133U4P8_9EURY|nr:hypothetical protein AKJ62_03635 [candidate division MSBL1 archaeon SCGC-AAA259D14]